MTAEITTSDSFALTRALSKLEKITSTRYLWAMQHLAYDGPAFKRHGPCSLGITESAGPIRGGMSGSPVIYAGKAVDILATDNWANPRLAHHLPAWMMPTRMGQRDVPQGGRPHF
jgi:hypothetical protein